MERIEADSPKIGVVFSSGFFGFFAHAGFLAALRKLGILPLAYGGASSGAIVAAMAACGMSNAAVREMLFRLRKEDFWDPDPWHDIVKKTIRLFRGYQGYLNGGGFVKLLGSLPVEQIQECERPLAIAATDLTHRKEAVFTKGSLVKAVHASCAVPILFKPAEIEGALYVDGGMINKAPVMSVSELVELERIIVHFIPSYNVQEIGNGFLKKRMTPWHIHDLSINICRQEAYQRQVEMVRRKGIEVIEVNTAAPSVGPTRLRRGPAAYEKAKAFTLKTLGQYMQTGSRP
jgi:NTE family protein